MKIQKTVIFDVDLKKERKRINKCFHGETRKRLLNLMDLVEEGKWEEAHNELSSEWWDGYDNKDHCPRKEYIGIIRPNSIHMSGWFSYIDLIEGFYNCPNVWSVIR